MTVIAMPRYEFVFGETSGQRAARIFVDHDGCSLKKDKDRLMALVCRGVEPEKDEEWVTDARTNCGTSWLGVLAATAGDVDTARSVHKLLAEPYNVGMAIAWLDEIGDAYGAWTKYESGFVVPTGCVLFYQGGPDNVHVECVVDSSKGMQNARHCGGGRDDNAITVGVGDIRSSWSRPLVKWMDIEKLPFPHAMAPEPEQKSVA